MPAGIDIEKIAARNPKVDIEDFKKGAEVLKDLQQLGTVRPSTYGVGTPESKRIIRPVHEDEASNRLPAFRRLR